MKINIILYRNESKIKQEVINFSNSFSNYKLNVLPVESIEELKSIYTKENYDLLIFDASNEIENIFHFLNESNIALSKIIILSSNKDYIWNFVKYSIFDFLLLPIETGDLLSCINRCIIRIVTENNIHQLRIAETRFQKFIPINSTKKIELIKLDEIVYFEADGRYTVIYLTNGVSKMASKNLGEFQKLLDPDIFCRIHHKFIINMNHLINIIKADGFYCEMSNNKNIPVSKRKLEDLNTALNIGKHLI